MTIIPAHPDAAESAAGNPPVVGDTWQGKALRGAFLILSAPEAAPGVGGEVFAGHRAKRLSDGAAALVGLTRKPANYPYDWVLLY